MNKKRKFTREELYSNCMGYNKYLTIEYLNRLRWKQLLCFCHPKLREEIRELGELIS